MFILAFVLLIAFVMLLWMLEVKLAGTTVLGKNAGVRVSGPCFSMSASGTIGKAVTYGTWKGRPWARVWFKPQNPKTAKQVNVRTAMRLCVLYWKAQDVGFHDAWDVYAAPFTISGFNKMVSKALDAYALDPGTGVVPVSVSHEGVAGEEVWTWNEV